MMDEKIAGLIAFLRGSFEQKSTDVWTLSELTQMADEFKLVYDYVCNLIAERGTAQ